MTTRLFRNIPIKRKLTGIIMLACTAALLLSSLSFGIYEQIEDRRSLVLDLSILTDVFDDNVAPGLAFSDPKSIEQTLRSLDGHPHILAAAAYDKKGEIVARYQRANLKRPFPMPSAQETGTHFEKDRLDAFRRVMLAGEMIGTIYITSDLTELSTRFWRYVAILSAVLLVASLLVLWLSSQLQKVISEPIFHLARTAAVVAAEKNYAIRAVKHGEDELGSLIDGFNEMLAQIQKQDNALQEGRDTLERRVEDRTEKLRKEIAERERREAEMEILHKQLLDTSRAAGMAEVATGVLHNVGNVLNSVNVSATLLADNLKKSRVANFTKVTALLDEHMPDLGAFITSDPKGKQLPGYLSQLAKHLAGEQKSALAEIDSLRKNIEHIKDIVSMQQSYAKVSGVTEQVKLADLVEDALRMNAGALARHDVQVVREYEEMKPITLDKHKVLQILVNLIRNAKYACDESGRKDKQLTIRVSNGGACARVAVADNGVGIPAENLTRIFNHGFTTRKDGHGFGLHSGALAAKEMGGDLRVESEGVSQGAIFTLELPLMRTSPNTNPAAATPKVAA